MVPHEAEISEESVEDASCVGNVVPRMVEMTEETEVVIDTSGVANTAPHDASEAPVEECYHIFDGETGRRVKAGAVHLAALPEVSELLNLEEMSMVEFLAELKAGEIAEKVLLRPELSPEEINVSSVMDEAILEELKKRREARLGSEILKNPKDPVYPLLTEFADVVSKDPPSQLPPNRGIRHEIDLVPGTNSTVPAQTPIPRKDVLLNNMAGCTLFSALDLVDGYYQILMRESDIPLTAVSTPSGMLWEWLVMPQGLSNDPATFNRLVTQLFRPLRAFTQTYFDDIFVHSRAEEGKTAIEVHLEHLRRVLEVMRANKLYANIDKCVFAAEDIKVLGCFVNSAGVRTDPDKVKAIAAWPTPRSQKDLRQWLGLANYLHKYSAGYANLVRPLSDLLKKDADWCWERQHQDAFYAIKASLPRAGPGVAGRVQAV
ncbi:unnamed protein product [Phytophthora lilii]|uniref:Unnamed protein product n=1 Tax=Phytophthora lilii TaxID=2077276 RepID=A0A9W6WQ88_9STRA|nr:unnamed protein product [Phytophthora lilii]